MMPLTHDANGDDDRSLALTIQENRWPVSTRPMGLGAILPMAENSAFGGTPHFSDILAMTRTAEAVGFDAVWIIDHFLFRTEPGSQFQMPTSDEGNGVWECFATMAGLASATERIQIGSLVACTGFRNPGLVAKMTETIDDISGGRVILGLGAGWHRPEYDAFGYPYDHRVSRFEEAMAIIHPLLRTGQVDFAGEFFQARDAFNQPRGPRATGAPILVGSSGPRMLRIIARYADAWNTVWHGDAEAIAQQLTALDEACHEVGRDPATLVRTAGGNIAMPGYLGIRPNPIAGEPEAIAEVILGFRARGIQHFVAGLDPCTPQTIEQFARVIELVDAG
ncbi:MAG: LLM class flavin-dependent oxidoreductase [Chloroflexia bacterium]|nr:LLM class flavin-dependent oxidoreductase [Chloroflexia bacterium]